MGRDRQALPERRTGGPTIATSVYEQLRHDIIVGLLAPGTRLGSDFLRLRYRVGISPVREALNRLAAEKLVCVQDQRGFHVAGVSRQDLSDLIQMRCWIEETALRQAILRGDAAWEEAIVIAFHRLSRTPRSAVQGAYRFNPEWETQHRDFHRALIACCGSARLLDSWSLLSDQADRYRQLAAASSYPDRAEGDEHRALMDAVVARDPDRAVALQAAHIRKTEAIIIDSGMALPPSVVAA